MKILLTNIHHGNGGGHVTYLMALIDGLLRQGHEPWVATPAASRLYRYAAGMPGVHLVDMKYTNRIGPMLAEIWQLRQLLARERFDIVHVNASADHRHLMLARLLLGRSKSRPAIVWTLHNAKRATSFGHAVRARYGTDAVIAISDYVYGRLVGSPYAGLPLHVIRHGIDTAHYAPLDVPSMRACRRRLLDDATGSDVPGDVSRQEPDGASSNGTTRDASQGALPAVPDVGPDGLGNRRPTQGQAGAVDSAPARVLLLGSVAGSDFDKGWLDLAEAAGRLPVAQRDRLRIVVAGDPPQDDRLDKLRATGMGGRVIFPGLVDDVRTVLGGCDIGFVLSHHEALSYACRETLSMGLPTLISDVGGLPENFPQDQEGAPDWPAQAGKAYAMGWIVPVRDVDAMQQWLVRVLEDPSVLPAMGRSARRHAEQAFGLEPFMEATLAAYDEARQRVG